MQIVNSANKLMLAICFNLVDTRYQVHIRHVFDLSPITFNLDYIVNNMLTAIPRHARVDMVSQVWFTNSQLRKSPQQYKFRVKGTTMATLIVMIILVIVADNIINSMVHSHVARNIVKTALGLIMLQSVGWVGVLALTGYCVARSKRARTAIKRGAHKLLTR